MKIAQASLLLAAFLLPSAFSLAQPELVTMPRIEQVKLKAMETAMGNRTANNNNTAARPTGTRQRLVRTENETGQPGGPFYTNDKMVYGYSGTRGSSTATHGLAPYSEYDTGYSLLHPASYAYQRFHPSGKLKYTFRYSDNSQWSGPGASQTLVKEYDVKDRLILDSMAQTGQPGANLDEKNRYGYDSQDRLIYTGYALNGYGPGSWDYHLISWKFYNGTDTLPVRDSVFLLDDNNVTTVKIVKHYYNGTQLAADSAFLINAPSVLYEATLYTYPEPGKQVGEMWKRVNNVWSPFFRTTIAYDNDGRETLLQLEDYQNGSWQKYVRRERQYTHITQDESIPTVEISYNDYGGAWTPFSKEVRTFRSDLHIDTLYNYASTTGYISASTIPSFTAYQYNGFGNLTQAYHHSFLEDTGEEINGYYTNYFYDEYEDPLAITHNGKEAMACSIYPNPSGEKIHLSVSAEGVSKLSLRITDISGNKLISKVLDKAEADITLQGLAPGVYLLQVADERSGRRAAQRIVKY